jgi:hypothetical protein
MRRLSIILLLCLATGCVSYRAVDITKPMDVGHSVSVQPQSAWTTVSLPGIGTVWTVDGIGLNEIRFHTGVAPGEPVFRPEGTRASDLASYDRTMLAGDVAEMVASVFTRAGYAQVRTSNLSPAVFGSDKGFRFLLSYTTGDGLEMKGMALAAQRDGKLDLILFIAPGEYYFERYRPLIEQIFSSVRTPPPATS